MTRQGLTPAAAPPRKGARITLVKYTLGRDGWTPITVTGTHVDRDKDSWTITVNGVHRILLRDDWELCVE